MKSTIEDIPKCPMCQQRELNLWESTCPDCKDDYGLLEKNKSEEKNMTKELWDKAEGGHYIKIEEQAVLGLKNWKIAEVEKTFKNQTDTKVEFYSECFELDGEVIDKKIFSTTSKRLIKKLRPIFEDRKPGHVWVSVAKMGAGYETKYSVKEVKAPKDYTEEKVENPQ